MGTACQRRRAGFYRSQDTRWTDFPLPPIHILVNAVATVRYPTHTETSLLTCAAYGKSNTPIVITAFMPLVRMGQYLG